MKNSVCFFWGALISFIFTFTSFVRAEPPLTTYTICSEKDSGLVDLEALVKKLNDKISVFEFLAISAGSTSNAIKMLRDGTCNFIEFDAGKSYGVYSDPSIKAKALGIEGSGSYVTMAIARKDKIVQDKVASFCDVIDRSTWKACHTGYMKSAGWISPMMALSTCAEKSDATNLKSVCSNKVLSGETCHNLAFADSCVPGMIDSEGLPKTGLGDEICASCRKKDSEAGLCSSTDYANYYGAALGLFDGQCDIAFVKTVTLECPEESHGYCVPAGEAECTKTSSCDKKSVYAKNYTVSKDVYVRVPGYGIRVPAHLLMARGVSEDHKDILMGELPDIWQEVYGKSLVDKHEEKIEDIIGKDFIEGLSQVPYFYESYGLKRPVVKEKVVIRDNSNIVVPIVVASASIALIATCIGIYKSPRLLAKILKYLKYNPQVNHAAADDRV